MKRIFAGLVASIVAATAAAQTVKIGAIGTYTGPQAVFGEMTDRAFPDYVGTTSRQRWHRDLLRRAMAAEGFTVYEAEWWHFDFRDWRQYGIGNRTFEEIAGGK